MEQIKKCKYKFEESQQNDEVEFLGGVSERTTAFSTLPLESEEPIKPITFHYSRNGILDSLIKQLQGEKGKGASPGVYQKKSMIEGNIKIVRKVPLTVPNSRQPSKKGKKEFLHAELLRTNFASLTNHETPQLKREGPDPATHMISDISSLEPRESLCHSFLSNLTAFLSERKSIYTLGGISDETNNMIKLSLQDLGCAAVAPLTSNRSKFGVVAVGRQIFILGGKRGKERVAEVETYHLDSKRWSRYAPMPKSKSGFGAVSIGELVYCIGGNDGEHILSSVEILDLRTGEWRRSEPMCEARDELAAVVGKDNRIYAIGGFGGPTNETLRSVEVFDIRSEKWRVLPPMATPRRAHSAAVLADGLYAIGGFDGSAYLSSVERYEEPEERWLPLRGMRQARCTHTSVALWDSQEIYVLGGFDMIPLDSIEKFSVISN